MQITADLINYLELSKYSASEIFNEVFEDDELSESLFVSLEDDDWSDSYRLYGLCIDACTILSEQIESEYYEKLKQGYFRIFLNNFMLDDLSLREFPDEGYVSSISVSNCIEIHSYLTIELTELLLETLVSMDKITEDVNISAYLDQWIRIISKAKAKKLGILIHMG